MPKTKKPAVEDSDSDDDELRMEAVVAEGRRAQSQASHRQAPPPARRPSRSSTKASAKANSAKLPSQLAPVLSAAQL